LPVCANFSRLLLIEKLFQNYVCSKVEVNEKICGVNFKVGCNNKCKKKILGITSHGMSIEIKVLENIKIVNVALE
jgi:hypothetical protein